MKAVPCACTIAQQVGGAADLVVALDMLEPQLERGDIAAASAPFRTSAKSGARHAAGDQ